jgi:hypothetical protein
MELFDFVFEVNDDHGLVACPLLYFERPMLHVLLDGLLRELSSDQTLSVEYCIPWIPCDLVFRGIAYEPLVLSECDVGGSGVVALVVGNNLYLIVEPHTHA